MDGTYTSAGCFLVAASYDHVIAWYWAHAESTAAYTRLFEHIAPPLCVVLDGGRAHTVPSKRAGQQQKFNAALSHAQRVIRRYTTSRPRTDTGKAIYAFALQLTRIHTLDTATQWTLRLHEFEQVFKKFLNHKTYLPRE